MAAALDAYMRPDSPAAGDFTAFPHYVIDGAGEIIQIADERERARHVAIPTEDRAMYASGAWRARVSPIGLAAWEAKWLPLGKRNPLQLFPSKSANEDFLGIELIPLLEPPKGGGRFTPEQYDRLADLLEDIETRYGLELEGSRLVGHEDLSPLTRWNKAGGWDPGALRDKPSFFWRELQRSDGSSFG